MGGQNRKLVVRRNVAVVAILATALIAAGGCRKEAAPDDPDDLTDAGDPHAGHHDDAGMPDAGPADTDIVLARLNEDGQLDTTFGMDGVAVFDLSARAGNSRDQVWNAAVDQEGRIVVFGAKRAPEPRVDGDRVVMRLTNTGALDTTFNDGGTYQTLNMGGLNDQARAGLIQSDKKIIAAGYTSQPTGVGSISSNKVVLLRLNEDGTVDDTFGYKGVVNASPFSAENPPGGVEAYGAGMQSGGRYVTTGYGTPVADQTPAPKNDMIAIRFTPAGAIDTTFGTQGNGAVQIDVAGEHDRGRAVVALTDDRLLMVGSGSPSASDVDAMVVMLNPDGTPDATFSPSGYKLYSFAGVDEAFYGLAVSPDNNWAAITGYSGNNGAQDNATLLLLPIGGTGSEVSMAVPLSDTEQDRFFGAAFDSSGRVYAAGFTTEGGNRKMVVVRFLADGTKDSSFGANGVATVSSHMVGSGDPTEARSVVVQADGKIIVAGHATHVTHH